ncbi:MAG: hypothetical protein SFY66_27305 [Oculatellaceae cyanobacterium bins.114]|nr:hypothetical protein [Oculatellaceae cyanobacterium bins.114]
MKSNCLHIILESADVPDQVMCVGLVHHVIGNLGVESLTQLRVYGRERGEDFPAWEEEVELKSGSILDTTELAKQGDIEAIATLVNQWLSSPAILAKVSFKNGCLRVLLETSEPIDQAKISSTLLEQIKKLGIQDCTQLKISSREPGDEFFDWQQEFNLSKTTDLQKDALKVLSEVKSSLASLTNSTEVATQSQTSQLELARKGDVQAISKAMNYLLQPKGLVAAITLTGDCLLVMLQSHETPDQEQTTDYVRKVLKELKLTSIRQVKLYGRRRNSSFTAWTEEFTLEQPQSISLWDSVMGTVSSVTGAVGCAVASTGGAIAGTATNVTGAVSGAVTSTGGAIASTATGVVGAIGGAALQTTDGVGYVIDMLSNSPHLQELTKTLQVDKFLLLIDKVDVVKAETHVKNLKRKYPNESASEIAHRIMLEKAIYVAGSGFASSVMPGFAAAMFAVDLLATMALQAEMVYQIASAYGLNLKEPARKGEVLAVFGMAFGGNAALKAGLGVARNIPVAGAAIGASSNAAMLYGLGYAACRFYEAKLNPGSQVNSQASQSENEKNLQKIFDQQVVMDQILVHLVLAGNPKKTLKQLLPQLKNLKLSPDALMLIQANPDGLPALEQLLQKLSRDFAVSLIAQCQKIAQADGVITPEELQIINTITTHLVRASSPDTSDRVE